MPRPRPAKKHPPRRAKDGVAHGGHNQLRIIGGQWRGRKLPFPSVTGLRPTPDRVRETVFNWLTSIIPGAHCLDLFAGSGALGLEALSRGAASVTLIDNSSEVTRSLEHNVQTLQTQDASIINQSALDWLPTADRRFDVVFLDPPFGQGLAAPVIDGLARCLTTEAWVYLEMGVDEALPPLPDNWHLYRHKQAGQVSYRLFQVGHG